MSPCAASRHLGLVQKMPLLIKDSLTPADLESTKMGAAALAAQGVQLECEPGLCPAQKSSLKSRGRARWFPKAQERRLCPGLPCAPCSRDGSAAACTQHCCPYLVLLPALRAAARTQRCCLHAAVMPAPCAAGAACAAAHTQRCCPHPGSSGTQPGPFLPAHGAWAHSLGERSQGSIRR